MATQQLYHAGLLLVACHGGGKLVVCSISSIQHMGTWGVGKRFLLAVPKGKGKLKEKRERNGEIRERGCMHDRIKERHCLKIYIYMHVCDMLLPCPTSPNKTFQMPNSCLTMYIYIVWCSHGVDVMHIYTCMHIHFFMQDDQIVVSYLKWWREREASLSTFPPVLVGQICPWFPSIQLLR